ncbi:chemotaxis response regulator protein-glutamate methylesterase [Malikia sp.]|uniref:protein-glutamate methylesterase/protein-glutamine glutaminase n=1 Tax=Malikia sp. TaxID=2070706 RepID=UPI002606A910|nr:chemotaxis response regulator protein-glutamate methylesterase [Malikia sp.]MDD2728887.1 chemotaxis response regulator protein-glutamate methylesterase [Malikia sp.]
MNTVRPIRVMLVDDSAVVRRVLADVLRQHGFQVIAALPDPLLAQDFLKKETPDVIVLDVEMRRMDGLTFLRQLMTSHPIPVVMCSTLTTEGAETTLTAMELGAVAFVTKPSLGLKGFLQDEGNGLIQAIRNASRSAVRQTRAKPPAASAPPSPAAVTSRPLFATSHKVVVIGISTGGVQAIEQVLPRLPRDAPGVVIVQHMPAKFTAALSQRLDGLCAMEVREARHGDRVLPGVVLIAPGGMHTRLARSGAQYQVEVFDGPPVNHHRPSVDVLFGSAAAIAGKNTIGVIMTGMGDDGARGLRELHQAGARTIAQDEASSVVFGMAKEAIKLGGVGEVVPLAEIADRILRYNKTA